MSWMSEFIQDKQFELPNTFKNPIEPLSRLLFSSMKNILKDDGKLFVITDSNRKIPFDKYYSCEKDLSEAIMDCMLEHDIEIENIYNSKKDEYVQSLGITYEDPSIEGHLNTLYHTIETGVNYAVNEIDHIKNYDEANLQDVEFIYNKINEMDFEPFLRLYKIDSVIEGVKDMLSEKSEMFEILVFLAVCKAYIKILEEFLNGRTIVKKTCITCDIDEILDAYKKDVQILYRICEYIETLKYK